MNKKLGLLVLIPLLSFMLVPVATASSKVTPSEPSGVWVYAFVSCGSSSEFSQRAGASLHYQGHTLDVLCTPGNEHGEDYEWFVTGQSTFTATVFAAGHHYTVTQSFGINDCGSSIYGKQETNAAEGVFDIAACFVPFE